MSVSPPSAPFSSGRRHPLRVLLSLVSEEKGRVTRAVAASVINKIFDVMPEILIGIALDVVVRGKDSFVAQVGITDPVHQLTLLGIATFLIWFGESLFEYFYQILWRGLAQDVQHRLRIMCYDHAQHLPTSFYEENRSGDLVAVLNDDINQLERFLDRGANELIQTFAAVILVGAVFFIVSPLIAVVAFTPVPVIIAGAFWFQRRAQARYDAVRARAGGLGARLTTNLQGLQTIRAFGAEARETAALTKESRAYVDANRAAIRVSSAFIPIIRMAILSGFLATFLIGGWLTLTGQMQVGAYGLLVFLTQRLLWPMTHLAEIADLYERAMASTRRILRLLDEPRGEPHGTHDAPVSGRFELEGVGFRYATSPGGVTDINLAIRAGETVALVGPTGSGKSTLIKLLGLFIRPQKGVIRLDGVPLADWSGERLRRSMAWVPQEVTLFSGSIADNIAYGKPSASREEVEAAARLAEADGFIRALPHGYESQIGEYGQKLSGGQRQRIALARALLIDPAILILDEATSAVDNETEAAIQRSLARMKGQRTVILVAHRLSTVVHADAIHVMDDGRIIQSGPHDRLVECPGLYRTLWNIQTGHAEMNETA
ncbi:ATP-binding cassette domain-containing protein [Shinella sp. AETb1-6]|uniref:ABC transporter ATP-binding protein n=1 Tax=Shinella sp. AETb1-6 TaxID=2692210 RepID=UPI00136E9CFC|nr:ABC transporter ATP-binding protein [Shinella sp. AETb1-6]MXN50416.1 ATP-binding cassette domain-containing protein [Shinella sp. AETb1-6]